MNIYHISYIRYRRTTHTQQTIRKKLRQRCERYEGVRMHWRLRQITQLNSNVPFRGLWDPRNWKWPITKKPDLIFFDPPYFSKKEKAYEKKAKENTPSISSYTKEDYERFLEGFFLLAHKNAKPTTRMAFLNADWRDFESTPALKEKPDKSITIFDYHRLLSKTGWKVTHRIECPLSSERLSGNQVQRMQDKRILGTVGRTLLIAKRA